MNDLSTLPTATLEAMKAQLTNWIVYIACIDCVVVALFVWFMVARSPRAALPLVPLIMIPAVALVPFLRRAAAIRRELERRTP